MMETPGLKVLALLMADALMSCVDLRALRRPRPRERLTVERYRGEGYAYSIYRAPDSALNPDILYYFHGAGQSDKSWSRWTYAREFYAACRRQNVPPPVVVSLSFGHLWVMTEDGPYRLNGLIRRFFEEALPAIESRTGAPRYRFAWGVSMGAFNLLELIFRRPELWRAAALSSPAVPTLTPMAEGEELLSFLHRTRARALRVRWMLEYVRPHFPTLESWLKHDPLVLAAAARRMPPLLIECGDLDEYGFFEGSQRLHAALRAAGCPATFSVRAGGYHCDIDSDGVVAFFRANAEPRGLERALLRLRRMAWLPAFQWLGLRISELWKRTGLVEPLLCLGNARFPVRLRRAAGRKGVLPHKQTTLADVWDARGSSRGKF